MKTKKLSLIEQAEQDKQDGVTLSEAELAKANTKAEEEYEVKIA